MREDKEIKLAVRRTEECSLPSRRDFLEKGKMVALALLGIAVGAKSAKGQTGESKHFRAVEIPGVVDESIIYQCAGGNCEYGCSTNHCQGGTCNLCPCNSNCNPTC